MDPLHVLGATAYPRSAASARVRVADFAEFLAVTGIQLEHRATLFEDEYQLLSSKVSPALKAAIVGRSSLRAAVISRRQPEGLLLIHRLLSLAPFPRVDPPRRMDIYDVDDALFVGSAAEVNRRFQWVKQEARRAVACMRRARLVTVANSFLADHARAHATRVEIIPSCVDPSRQPLHDHRPTETVTIGWIGSPTTAAYLSPVLPVLERLSNADPRLKLVVVGGDTRIRASWIEHRPWAVDRQAADLASFDIGIMPLPDTTWARGKAGYKLLQYFAAGVPAIASPVGINAQLVTSDRGLVASNADEWQDALVSMLREPERRRSCGASARAFVEREYSYQRWAPELASLLRGLA